MQVRTRAAVASDSIEVAELFLRSRRASLGSIPPLVHDEDSVHGWMRQMVLPTGGVRVAVEGDRIVGFLVCTQGEVDQLYVDPASTGQGVGSRLLRQAKQEHPHGLELWTFVSNRGARRFYERHGFVEIGGTDGDNEEGEPDVRLRWPGDTD